ncbi:MAG: SRPBCC domain-containing protein [Bacteroidetes bacterium]|nr:MAG: SRPBCC domain-containing protein [Bacteroidota bacterium]REK05685.1 MAG: SRPBCC domain-containing protein [Bacteroidota bacterium]REK32009.1 MAG: SRPBCC domain-containing protein [Bacteroidota bacterium]REK50073.1 MAG: SRPBCC domain-containing protein [Bacteroidota bacterium]
MESIKEFITLDKQFDNKKVIVDMQFKTGKSELWDAFTTAEMMEKWWAPLPYKAVIKKMSFSNGGRCLYYMLSPQGEKHWCIADFSEIVPGVSYFVTDAFCDENEKINIDFPSMNWKNIFSGDEKQSRISSEISFKSQEDMKKFLELGFEEGYKIALTQLKRILE